jgi:hypothetical protein
MARSIFAPLNAHRRRTPAASIVPAKVAENLYGCCSKSPAVFAPIPACPRTFIAAILKTSPQNREPVEEHPGLVACTRCTSSRARVAARRFGWLGKSTTPRAVSAPHSASNLMREHTLKSIRSIAVAAIRITVQTGGTNRGWRGSATPTRARNAGLIK